MAIDKNKVQDLAQKYFVKGQLDKAIKEYELLLEDDPNDMKSCQRLGEIYAKKGDNRSARKYLERVADDFGKKCFYAKGIALIKQLLKNEPADLPLNLKLASLYNLQGLKADAVNQYRMVAGAYEKAGKIVEALEVIAKMADIDASNVVIRIKLAERYVREGFKDKAVEHLLKAGAEYRKQSKLDDLINVYEKFLGVSPGNKTILKELGTAYKEKGNNEKALSRMQMVLQADSDDVETLSSIAEIYKAMGEPDKAKSAIKHVLKVKPEAIASRMELAAIYRDGGDQSKALSEYEMIVDLHLKDEKFDDALKLIDDLLKAAPDDERVLGKLCEIYWIMKNVDKQVETYKTLAKVYQGRGEDAKSRDIFKRILELRPGDKEAKDGLSAAEGEASAPAETAMPSEEMAAREGKPLSRNEIKKILTEAEVYIKYGMEEKALTTLKAVLESNPDSIETNLKLKDLYLVQKKTADAIVQLMHVVSICRELGENGRGVECLKEVLKLKPGHKEATDLLESMAGADVLQEETGIFMEMELPDDMEIEMEGAPEEETELTLETELPETTEELSLEVEEELDMVSLDEEADEEETLEAVEELDEMPLDEFEEDLLEAEPLDAELIDVDDEIVEEELPLEEGLEELEEIPTLDDIQPLGLADVGEMLEEVQFYIHQELFDKARASAADILELDPENADAIEMVKNIDALEAEKASAETIEEAEPLAEEFFDLSSELAGELAEGGGGEGELLGFDELFDSFKAGVAKQVSNEDTDTHYNLGIAYREMGLFDDAMNEFRIALKDPAKAVEANSMLGLCCMDKGAPGEAIEFFKAGMNASGITREGRMNMSYDLALAYRMSGRLSQAKVLFEEIMQVDRRFRDVEKEYVACGEPGSGDLEDIPGMETVSEKDLDGGGEEEAQKKDKVSYI